MVSRPRDCPPRNQLSNLDREKDTTHTEPATQGYHLRTHLPGSRGSTTQRAGGDIATRPHSPAQLEAECRRLMAANAGIHVRGWDSQRARLIRLSEIDKALDNWLEAATPHTAESGVTRWPT